MAHDKTAGHRASAARHEDAAKTHDRAASFWEGRGDTQRAALQHELAAYERHGAELELRWAALSADSNLSQSALETADAARQDWRQGAEEAVANLMQLAETLERSAELAEEHASRSEREGNDGDAAKERAAADNARDGARRARSQAEGWQQLLGEDT